MDKCSIALNGNPFKSKMATSKDENDLMQLVIDDVFEGKEINAVDLPYYAVAFDMGKAFLMSCMTDKQKAYYKELLERYRLLSISNESSDTKEEGS